MYVINAAPITRYTSARQEDRRLGDCFREHLRSTRVDVHTDLPTLDLPIDRHFASSHHSIDDILVSVIRTGFRVTAERRRLANISLLVYCIFALISCRIFLL